MVAEKKGRAGAAGDATAREAPGKRVGANKPAEGHVASALKTAYQETVQEDVPSEFLDLLGKLA